MKAIVCTRWGPPDVLELREVGRPTPRDDEVLIRIHATTVTAGDCEMRGLRLTPLLRFLMRIGLGLRGPRNKVIGQELAGEIQSVGKNVRLLKTGDQVFAATGFRLGAYAEYICLPEDGALTTKPANITYEEAAAVPVGGIHALHFLRKANIQNGQKVLIIGAGGSIGTSAVQIAKSFGAEVTGVDSTRKLDMLSSIGADHVIDYTKEDFTKSGETYDVIFDVVGKSSFSNCVGSLKAEGIYLSANRPGMSRIRGGREGSRTRGTRVGVRSAPYKIEYLAFLRELVETGKMKPVIDRCYPLERMVEAHRYVETGDKKGNVVITVVPGADGRPDAASATVPRL